MLVDSDLPQAAFPAADCPKGREMIAILIAMSIVLGVAAGITGLVLLGLQGRGSEHVPKLADQMSRAARHLNGEGQPPRSLMRTH